MTKHHKKLLIGVTVILVFFMIILIVIDKNFTKPTSTHATTSPYPQTKLAAPSLIPTSYSDNFISFNYPSIMSMSKTPSFTLPIVDIANLSYADIQSWLLSVQVSRIPSGNFYNNSAYLERSINPTVYKLSQSTINGVTIPIFTDITTTAYNRVAFLISGEYQASVSLTGNDTNGTASLASTMAMVLGSWQWQAAY